MNHGREAFSNFWLRYKQAFKQIWQIRDQLDPPDRTADERDFLPAHLELVETPVSPTPRWSMRLIISFAGIALLWAILGQMDIVAVATGKTITNGRTKVIQPLVPGVVESIHVSDGQYVTAGQLLIKLDAVAANADYQQAKELLEIATLMKTRYSAFLAAIESGERPKILPLAGLTEAQRYNEENLLLGMYKAYLAKIETQKMLIMQKRVEINTVRQQVNKLVNTSKIADSRATDYQSLYDEKFISKHDWLQKEQERIEQKSDLSIQHSRITELEAALNSQTQELVSIIAQYRNDALEKQKQAQDNIIQYQQEVRKSQQRQEILTLVAPVSGTVQQLAIHTVGGVVTEAQALMAIVPENETVEVEAMVENKDIGFVKVGQEAAVKIESFPYTRHGYIEGIVASISHDAVQDEKRGLIFPARVRLKQTYLMVEGEQINLTSGMSVFAEIKTGKRRVIDYFLSPLREYSSEGLRER
ncbi:HlyD family type I secretion periplasmic adaptor subunit [Serratia sp. DD3]|uniref:HlyD family type I secretion periplasmic adaptor subunit n=1 Tax=Serratia sp. DD3 TaxID=1410619 RepID=UPI0003C51747|nr:HlyD family type I secretion periplasmic adaptor subunit [Serratia sp. DD3]KEY60898.1 hemolysin secretion protein D, plasmid [Serratia sp. DD3]